MSRASSRDVIILRWVLVFFTLIVHCQGGDVSLGQNESAHRIEPFVLKTRSFRSFGQARYSGDQPMLNWGDLAVKSRGDLGRICSADGHHKQCGDELVCRKGVCRHCITNRECPSLHSCVPGFKGRNFCIKDERMAWERAVSEPYDVLGNILIFLSSALAAAAGTGGGGMFVPLLVLLTPLKPEEAVPLSQCMIFFSSLVNLAFFVAQRHITFPDQPKIDYDCVVLFEPMLCLGVTVGVLLHQICPNWFLLVMLCVCLGTALWRTASKGIKQWKEEKRQAGFTPRRPVETMSYFSDTYGLIADNKRQVCALVLVWFLLLCFSFHGLSPCSLRFGVMIAGLAAMLILLTMAVNWWVLKTGRIPKPIDWGSPQDLTSRNGFSPQVSPRPDLPWQMPDWMHAIVSYPLVAFGAGMLGGTLGLGGGIIMSPVLVEVGMHSEAVQATTAVIVFVSSSLATIQFYLLDAYVWHYVIWYSAVAVCATFFGQRVCAAYLQRTGHYSVITLSIAGVILFSLLALAVVGSIHTVEDIQYGHQMWFSTNRMCSGGSPGIFDVDVTPAQAWPKDMPAPI